MKKFGTPIGAAPGSEKENVGFEGVGTPPFPRRAPGFVGAPPVEVVGVVELPPLKPPLLWLLDFFLPEPELFLCEPPELLCELPVEPEDCGAELDELGDGEDEEGDGLEEGAAHDSETPMIGNLTGSDIAETGVPGGTLTENVSFWPPTTVTVTVHCSAEAVGRAASAETTSTALAHDSATIGFRLLKAMAYLLPPLVCATPVP